MEITEVRIKLVSPPGDKLRAFCSITLDDQFVIRDLKIIEGTKGAFVAMPSRKLSARCRGCGGKNHFRARYCNDCGTRLTPQVADDRRVDGRSGPPSRSDSAVRVKLHADVAHPINSACREELQARVLDAYEEELARSRQPGYRPMSFDVFDEDFFEDPGEQSDAGEPAGRAADGDFAEKPKRGFFRRDVDSEARGDSGARGDSERRSRFFDDDDDEEPEDNFGAGLFS